MYDLTRFIASVRRLSTLPLRNALNTRHFENPFVCAWPPGHYYSPVPSLDDIKSRELEIFAVSRSVPGIDLGESRQLELLNELAQYYTDQPFNEDKTPGLHYFFDNPNFRHGEAIILYCMMRYTRPKRIIEIGAGYSSCVMLDVNQLFFDSSIECTIIDPDPELLLSLIGGDNQKKMQIIRQRIQRVDLSTFSTLSAGDILFVDSSHVCKIDSDVNYVLFQVIPALKPGVFVHFHDIYYPFEYPKEWVYQGRAWSEAYLLRAFLQYNDCYSIQLFNSFLGYYHRSVLAAKMPLCAQNPGSSLWIRKQEKKS
jgi:predicted O-methyltransferase YrrM